jgi:parvulin-like peptidyl-prolyl isomerase
MRKLTLLLLLSSVVPLVAQVPWPSHQGVNAEGPPATEVARVNGVALSSTRLAAELNALLPFESFHSGVDPAKLAQLRAQALDRLVNEELEYQEGLQLDVRISEERVLQEVSTVERKFGNRAALLEALARSGATMAILKRELRRTLTVGETVRRSVTVGCQVTRADASAYFAANPGRFVVPEQLHVFAITIGVDPTASPAQWSAAKARAEAVRRQIVAGASFEEMARTHSTDGTRAAGGDMGFLHRGSLADEFEAATRELPLRQPSTPVQSIYGYHLVEVAEIRPPRQQAFAEVASSLEKDLMAKRCEAKQAEWVGALRARSTIILADTKA